VDERSVKCGETNASVSSLSRDQIKQMGLRDDKITPAVTFAPDGKINTALLNVYFAS